MTIGSTPASSTSFVQDGEDINVTWAVTSRDLLEGFTLDPATGIVSGYSADVSVVDTTVTLTGTTNARPSQTATKNVTIHAEPEKLLSGD